MTKIAIITDSPLPSNFAAFSELKRMLAETGIDLNSCEIFPLFSRSLNVPVMFSSTGTLFQGLRPTADVLSQLNITYQRIATLLPSLIIITGNYGLWALTTEARIIFSPEFKTILIPSGIGDFRGSMLFTKNEIKIQKTPVLPILSPESIIKSWEFRATTIHDLKTRVPKALHCNWERRHKLYIQLGYKLPDVVNFFTNLLSSLDHGQKIKISNDIETRNHIITCIGFALNKQSAFVLPLVRKSLSKDFSLESHWTIDEEIKITRLLSRVLSHPNAQFIGQNYSYDMTYLKRFYGVTPNVYHDTLAAQHLIFPGTQKDLGYLSSIYCEYHRYWKDDNKEWDAKSTMAEHFNYNGEDCIRTFEIHENQLSVIEKQNILHLWQKEILKLKLAFKMSTRGVLMNMNKKAELSIELGFASQARISRLLSIVPQALIEESLGKKQKTSWPTSTAQQKILFTDILNMNVQLHRKTRQPTLDKEAIPKLKKQYPHFSLIFDILLELRSINVFASTFVNAGVDPDKRIRTSFNSSGTETFRWSSSKNAFETGCNFQNLPKGKEL